MTNCCRSCCERRRNELVVQWMDGQSNASLFTTTVTQDEILYGVFTRTARGTRSKRHLIPVSMK